MHGNPALVHRAVHILVLSPSGELLLQKRSARKDVQPGRWDTSVGGHVSWGQSYWEAGQREAQEELGIVVEKAEFLYHSRIRNEIESENIATYLTFSQGPFLPEPGEIDELKFWRRSEIEANLGKGLFTSNFEEEFAAFCASPYGPRLI